MSIIRYFFPPRNPITKIPLKTKVYAAKHHRYGTPPDELRADLRIVAGSLSISERSAYLLHMRHPELTPSQLIRRYKRERRRTPPVQRFLIRLRRWWNG